MLSNNIDFHKKKIRLDKKFAWEGLNYTLAYALELRKITENLSQGSWLVLH
jgi:hypothetical protein